MPSSATPTGASSSSGRASIELGAALERLGGGLIVRHGRARAEIPALAGELAVQAVFANHDYEPAAIERDAAVARALAAQGRELHTYKDQVIFEKDEVLTRDGRPFSVFTAYKNAWLAKADALLLQGLSGRALRTCARAHCRLHPCRAWSDWASSHQLEGVRLPTGDVGRASAARRIS